MSNFYIRELFGATKSAGVILDIVIMESEIEKFQKLTFSRKYDFKNGYMFSRKSRLLKF